MKKEGFHPTFLKIDRTWSWWVLGDIFGCLVIFSPICIMNDMDQGGYYTFDDKVYVTLEKKNTQLPPYQ